MWYKSNFPCCAKTMIVYTSKERKTEDTVPARSGYMQIFDWWHYCLDDLVMCEEDRLKSL